MGMEGIKEGVNATVQVVTSGDGGGGLYNVRSPTPTLGERWGKRWCASTLADCDCGGGGIVRRRDFLRRSAAGQLHERHGRQGGAVYRQGCQCERHELGGTGRYACRGRGCDGEYGAEEWCCWGEVGNGVGGAGRGCSGGVGVERGWGARGRGRERLAGELGGGGVAQRH